MKYLSKFLIIFIVLLSARHTEACTNYLITKGASVDGSVMISYAADSHIRYGELYFRKGGTHISGEMVKLYDRGTNKLLGEIPEAPITYNVVGFMNEHQVAIGETTFGGRPELIDTSGIIDYGSLMFLAMQRATSARDAIRIIAELTDKYGYCSSGESFSISDANEVWIMEIIGKGSRWEYDKKLKKNVNRNKGMLWVAIRIPDGYISAHANHARITNFTLEDKKRSLSSTNLKLIFQPEIEVVYANDVILFARERGYFSGKDEDFSFSDTYAPINFEAARFSEMRVWAMFREVNEEMEAYRDYATGQNLNHRMPLYIKPNRKLSPADLMSFKRNYLQGTEFDMTKDAGAGAFGLPYRWRPLTWKVDGKEYFNERTTVTQQTGFSYIAQSRSWLPDPIGGISWFGVDDAGSTVYVPMYCGINYAPEAYAEGNGSMLKYSPTSAFWLFNKVANFAYGRYNLLIEDIRKVQSELEMGFQSEVPGIDKKASEIYASNPAGARAFLSEYSSKSGAKTVERWEQLFQFLLVKYIDGNVKVEKNGVFQENGHGYPVAPKQPGYSESFLRQIVEKHGEQFRMPEKK
jgi:dipeptidase